MICLNCPFNRLVPADTHSPVYTHTVSVKSCFLCLIFPPQLRGLKEHNSSLVAKAVTGMNSKDKMQNMFARCNIYIYINPEGLHNYSQ